MSKPKLLLHDCCAPCGGFLFLELSKKFDISIYYDNSNIHPFEEYQKRRDEAKKFFISQGADFFEFQYDHKEWLEAIKGLEKEPERGRRCAMCYCIRLEKAAKFAEIHKFDCFATTLSISPHKDVKLINAEGKRLAEVTGVEFLAKDWKKNNGWKYATEFSREQDFYRQNYCGCEFSRR